MERAAAIALIKTGTRVVGVAAAFAPAAGAGLVGATSEVADWVETQVELAERMLRARFSWRPRCGRSGLRSVVFHLQLPTRSPPSSNTDPVRARELGAEFGDFNRYSFRRHGDFTTLAEELRCIDRYLPLERARFGDRAQVSLRIAPEVLSTANPFLRLQPLVENAVRHGLEAKEGPGHIFIAANESGAFAEVTIEDDGVGRDPEQLRAVLAGHGEGDHVGP